jgi:hypothetical protein
MTARVIVGMKVHITTQLLSFTVDRAPTFKSSSKVVATTGADSNFVVRTQAYPAASLTVTSGSLASGVTFHDNGDGTGALIGTPASGSGGIHQFTVTASNAYGSRSLAMQMTVYEPPHITSADHTSMLAGNPSPNPQYFVVTTTGYPKPRLVESGALPQGLVFSQTGLYGKPAYGTWGTYTLTITAINLSSGRAPQSDTQTFTLTMN